ncbi:hypothetical protein A2U01_0082448, partial [Trifolium medium]|nr:hypothetical protein [Trifolium medium]
MASSCFHVKEEDEG